MVPTNRDDAPDDQGTNTFANLAAQIKSKQRNKALDSNLKNQTKSKVLTPVQKIIQNLPPAPEKPPLQPMKKTGAENPARPLPLQRPVALGSNAKPVSPPSPENPGHRRPPPNAVARATQPPSPVRPFAGTSAPLRTNRPESGTIPKKSSVPQNLPENIPADENDFLAFDAGSPGPIASPFPGHYQAPANKPPAVATSTSLSPTREPVTPDRSGLSAEQLYAMAKMGYTQWEYGKLERAQAIFQTLVTQKPNEPWFRCALGSIFQKQRQFAQAIQQYNIALQLDPKDIPSRVNRGEIFLKVGKNREAYADLAQAVKLDASGKHPAALRARSLLSALKHNLPG